MDYLKFYQVVFDGPNMKSLNAVKVIGSREKSGNSVLYKRLSDLKHLHVAKLTERFWTSDALDMDFNRWVEGIIIQNNEVLELGTGQPLEPVS